MTVCLDPLGQRGREEVVPPRGGVLGCEVEDAVGAPGGQLVP